MHLQEIAQSLGVHKVSAHRAMNGLSELKLVKVQEGSDARYRYFTIPASRKDEVNQIISATKASHIPIGRGVLSLGLTVQDQVMQGLRANGLRVELTTSAAPSDIMIHTDKGTVGLEIKIITTNLSDTKFNEVVGRIMTSRIRFKQRLSFLAVVLIGAYPDELVEMSRRLETQLHDGLHLDVKFLWIRAQPLDLDSKLVRTTIVEPILKILDQWRLR